MTIDTNAIVSAAEANQNSSKAARMAEKKGHAVVFKNNCPKLLGSFIHLAWMIQYRAWKNRIREMNDSIQKTGVNSLNKL